MSGDSLIVADASTNAEQRIFLASIRAPRHENQKEEEKEEDNKGRIAADVSANAEQRNIPRFHSSTHARRPRIA